MLTDWSALNDDNIDICSPAGRKETVINWLLMNANSFLSEFIVSLKTLDWDVQIGNALHQIKNVIYLKLAVMSDISFPCWYLWSVGFIEYRCSAADLMLQEGENTCWTILWIYMKPTSYRMNYYRIYAPHLDCDFPLFSNCSPFLPLSSRAYLFCSVVVK